MASVRSMSMRDAPMGDTPMRDTPIKCSLLIVIDENVIIACHAFYNGRLRGVAQPEVAPRPKLQPKLRPRNIPPEQGELGANFCYLGKGAHQSARTIGTNHRYVLGSLEGRWPRGIVSKRSPVDISTSALLMDESSKHSTKTVRLRSGITYLPGSFFLRKLAESKGHEGLGITEI
jgi:hypothetical protein